MILITIQILVIHVYTTHFSVNKTFLFFSFSSSQLDYSTHIMSMVWLGSVPISDSSDMSWEW
jgi:hypothetical protein